MSKHTEFTAAQEELKVLRAQTTLSVQQVDHGNMGGASTTLMINAPKEVVKWLVQWLNKEPEVAITKAKGLCKIEVEALRLAAKAELEAWIASNSTPTV